MSDDPGNERRASFDWHVDQARQMAVVAAEMDAAAAQFAESNPPRAKQLRAIHLHLEYAIRTLVTMVKPGLGDYQLRRLLVSSGLSGNDRYTFGLANWRQIARETEQEMKNADAAARAATTEEPPK